MNDDYLWDGSGCLDPDVAHFERWAGTFGAGAEAATTRMLPLRHEPARRASRMNASLGWGIAAALFLVWLGLWGPKVPLPSDPQPPSSMQAAVVDHDDGAEATVVSPPLLPTSPRPRMPVETTEPSPAARASSPAPEQSRPRRARSDPPRATPPADDMPTTLDPAYMSQLRAHGPQIQRCFREHAPTNPKGGLVMLEVAFGPDGSVTRASFERHNFLVKPEGRATGQCLLGVLKRWRLPPSTEPLRTTPVVLFHPGHDDDQP